MTEPDGTTAEVVAGQLPAQLAALAQRISTSNRPGDLDGLFAYHLLHDLDVPIAWDVDPLDSQWIATNADRLRHAPYLAALGYTLHHFARHGDEAARGQLTAGLVELMRRDPFPADGVAFVHDPRQLLGITLAVGCIHDELPQLHGWLARVINDPRLRTSAPHFGPMRLHVRGMLADDPQLSPNLAESDATDLATLYWMLAVGTARLADAPTDLPQIERKILTSVMSTAAATVSSTDAALLLSAATRIVHSSIDATMLSLSHIGVVLRRFPAAMKRWRWDNPAEVRHPIQWKVTAEREVQDIVWIMLRTVFEDVVDEEPLRRVGHSSYRSDFGLPRLGTLVEIKYARTAADFKKIEKEVFEDSVAYLHERTTYKQIVVFIYDTSSSVQEHDLTTTTLLALQDVIDVVIVSRPSQLPAPGAETVDTQSIPRSRTRTRRGSAPQAGDS